MKRTNKKNLKEMPKTNFFTFKFTVMLVFATLLSQSCKDKPENTNEPPEVQSLSISEGQPGATVSISGTNFKDGADGVTVYFGTYAATVSSSTATEIVCYVPENIPAGTYDITVSVDGVSSAKFSGFTINEAKPVASVSGFAPDNGSFGDEVTITGTNFGDDQTIVKVTINGVEQEIKTFTDSTITITLKEKTFSGEVAVWVDGVKYAAKNGYSYKEKYFIERFGITDFANPAAIAIDKDSNVYITDWTYGLIKFDKDGNKLNTLLAKEYGSLPYGLFYGNNDTLYISDAWGRIMFLAPGNDAIDTLVHSFEDDNIKADSVWEMTGDNNGNLYISSGSFGYGVTKYNLREKKSTIIYTNNETTGTISFYNGRVYVNTFTGISSFKPDGTDLKRPVENLPTNNINKLGFVFHEKLDKFIVASIDNSKAIYLMDSIDFSYTPVAFENTNPDVISKIAIDKSGDLIVGCYKFVKKIVIK